MKTAVSALAIAALIFASGSCAKHDWEETQVLHEGMHKGHGDAHHVEGAAEAQPTKGEVHLAKPGATAPAPAPAPAKH
jgi:hypothetical protein